jgi:hypothetical protein
MAYSDPSQDFTFVWAYQGSPYVWITIPIKQFCKHNTLVHLLIAGKKEIPVVWWVLLHFCKEDVGFICSFIFFLPIFPSHEER